MRLTEVGRQMGLVDDARWPLTVPNAKLFHVKQSG